MPKDLELAKELHGVNWTDADWDYLDEDDKQQFIDLAKHVNQLLIDRVIDELREVWRYAPSQIDCLINQRIAQLQKEKELL